MYDLQFALILFLNGGIDDLAKPIVRWCKRIFASIQHCRLVGGGGIVKDFITKLETSKLGFVIFLQ